MPPNFIQINLVFCFVFIFCLLFLSSVISFHSIRHARALHVDREFVCGRTCPQQCVRHVFKPAARLAAVASFISDSLEKQCADVSQKLIEMWTVHLWSQSRLATARALLTAHLRNVFFSFFDHRQLIESDLISQTHSLTRRGPLHFPPFIFFFAVLQLREIAHVSKVTLMRRYSLPFSTHSRQPIFNFLLAKFKTNLMP